MNRITCLVALTFTALVSSGCVILRGVSKDVFEIQTPAAAPNSPLRVGQDPTASIVLPDGMQCVWREALEVDGRWVAYTCGRTAESEVVLVGEIASGYAESEITLMIATLTDGDGGPVLSEPERRAYMIGHLELADGDFCYFAGYGAAGGVDDDHANWECSKSSEPLELASGPLVPGGPGKPGVWFADKGRIGGEEGARYREPTQRVAILRMVLTHVPSA